jgi:hypothetical protein
MKYEQKDKASNAPTLPDFLSYVECAYSKLRRYFYFSRGFP